ncbi:hypothetical protein GUJ93_ZPchr0012g18770 [Zizania palustris]|uniref:DUF4378 domain-containing protein n=1 Tax=Zizania palustris TaxID=103762 RepID=A0A8J5WJC5_ZIZPA|nr:hypothetical protein GUJ93_ZPchr0012g18770 [Zizania palustris]
MATMAGGSKPLRLKDLLELDCESCSAAGFRCYPRRLCVAGAAVATASSSPVRHLLDADALARFARSSSTGRSKLFSLSKTLTRRLTGGLWRRRDDDEAAPAAAASSPAPAVSTCSCSSDSETSESSNSTPSQSESEFSSSSSDSLHAGEPSTTGDEHEVRRRESKEEAEEIAGSSSEADDKEQLSPVGVMDFPFDDDDGGGAEAGTAGACSASFSDSLALLQRRKTQLPHKIRRLGTKGELGGVDLEARFAASMSDDATARLRCSTDAAAAPRADDRRSVVGGKGSDEYSLLYLLVDTVSVGVDDVTERLLLDFFVEETRCRGRTHAAEFRGVLTGRSRDVKRQDSGGASSLRLARAWLEGAGTSWSLDDVVCNGEAVIAGMERSRRWLHTGEEQGEIAVVVAAMVVDQLVHELVSDLVG